MTRQHDVVKGKKRLNYECALGDDLMSAIELIQNFSGVLLQQKESESQ
jgi:hypothetical protein